MSGKASFNLAGDTGIEPLTLVLEQRNARITKPSAAPIKFAHSRTQSVRYRSACGSRSSAASGSQPRQLATCVSPRYSA